MNPEKTKHQNYWKHQNIFPRNFLCDEKFCKNHKKTKTHTRNSQKCPDKIIRIEARLYDLEGKIPDIRQNRA